MLSHFQEFMWISLGASMLIPQLWGKYICAGLMVVLSIVKMVG